VIRERERALSQCGRSLHERLGERCAIEERVGRVAVEFDVAVGRGGRGHWGRRRLERGSRVG